MLLINLLHAELAAEMYDFVTEDLLPNFPRLRGDVKISTVELASHLLNTYDMKISAYTAHKFRRSNNDVITNTRVVRVTEDNVEVMDMLTGQARAMPYGLCVWSTGNGPAPLTKLLSREWGGDQQPKRALVVDDCLRAQHGLGAKHGREFGLGDMCALNVPALKANLIKSFEDVLAQQPGHPKVLSFGRFQMVAAELSRRHPLLAAHLVQMEAKFAARASRHRRPDIYTSPGTSNASDINPNSSSNNNASGSSGSTSTQPTSGPQGTGMFRRLWDGGGADVTGEGFAAMTSSLAMDDLSVDEVELRAMIEDVDKRIQSFPATAQVAAQQGSYLAQQFNAAAKQASLGAKLVGAHAPTCMMDPTVPTPPLRSGGVDKFSTAAGTDAEVRTNRGMRVVPEVVPDAPFQYRHMGSFAYVGDNESVMDLGKGVTASGVSIFWLWKSIFLSKAVSLRTRIFLAVDWCKSWAFGRDIGGTSGN
eukprot:jgi/Mesvir1/27825/Mv07503-RA.1